MIKNFNVGDIVYCDFPSDDGSFIGKHYCMVIDDSGMLGLKVAFGTSKKIDSCPLDHEFVVSKASDLKDCGLRKLTKFNFKKIRLVNKDTADLCGSVNEGMYFDIRKAFNHASK
jgi:hypothetical protein